MACLWGDYDQNFGNMHGKKKKQARDKGEATKELYSDFMTRGAKKESATCRNCTSEAHMFHIGRSIWVWNSNHDRNAQESMTDFKEFKILWG